MRRTSPGPHCAGSRGFSLIEVLAAFVILALVVTALFSLFSGALANAAASGDWSRAVLIAQSRLALASSALPLVEATERGSEDGGRVSWETRVRAWEPPDTETELAEVSDGMATRLYRIEVDVRFPGIGGGERAFSLSTLKLATRNLP